jgi:hypothetical protein
MAAPHKLVNGVWIDLEKIGCIMSYKGFDPGTGTVRIDMPDIPVFVKLDSLESAHSYRDELAAAWIKACAEKAAHPATFASPVPPPGGHALAPGERPIGFIGSSTDVIVVCDNCGAARVGIQHVGETCGASLAESESYGLAEGGHYFGVTGVRCTGKFARMKL